MATKAQIEFTRLNVDAMRRLEDAYVNALASQIAGTADKEEWEKFRVLLERSMLLAALLGAADVVSIAKAGGAEIAIDNTMEKFARRRRYQVTQLVTAPFDEAVEAFLDRVPQLRSVVDTLGPDLRSQSFWVTGIESTEALSRIQARLGKELQNIKAGEDFGLQPFISFFEDEGFKGLTAARLETVYRTNTLSAFNTGRFKQMSSPAMVSQTALWRLNEVKDRRTRGNPTGLYPFPKFGPHFQMNGFLAAPSDLIWRIIWPPNGYNCRANTSPITWRTAERMGLAMEGQLILDQLEQRTSEQRGFVTRGLYPDAGFSQGPGLRAA